MPVGDAVSECRPVLVMLNARDSSLRRRARCDRFSGRRGEAALTPTYLSRVRSGASGSREPADVTGRGRFNHFQQHNHTRPGDGFLFHRRLFSMTDSTTRQCRNCGKRFSLTLRQGRNSRRARANQERSYHQGQRYCSATCRKLASKARRTRSVAPVTGPISGPSMRDKAPQGTKPLSGVTNHGTGQFGHYLRGSKIDPFSSSNDVRRLYRRSGSRLAGDVPRP
jgi:hypothetical protein